MPLFGPNIKRMKEKRDIEELIKELKKKDPKKLVETVEALIDIDDPHGINPLVKFLLALLRLGNDEDKIEAITLIQGRASTMFLRPMLGSRGETLTKAFEKTKFRRKLNIDLVHPALFETATDPKNRALVYWYALIALVELGDRSDEVASLLIKTAEIIMTWFKESDIMRRFGIKGFNLEIGMQEETLRALSYFTGNSKVRDALIDSLKARCFVGWQKISSPWRPAIYALGAFGDTYTREHLEYWATYGDEPDRKRAQVALELFGRATFDEVKAKVQAKFGID